MGRGLHQRITDLNYTHFSSGNLSTLPELNSILAQEKRVSILIFMAFCFLILKKITVAKSKTLLTSMIKCDIIELEWRQDWSHAES